MPPLSSQRHTEPNYHYEEGKAWLDQSGEGRNTTSLCYAAFEFRLQIERIGLQHWSALKPDGLEAKDLLDARSFKKIENRIYELAGHQREIDARYEFARILMNLLKIDLDIVTPKLGQLSHYWHACSELCHIASSFALSNPQFAREAHAYLKEISEFIGIQIKGLGTVGKLPDCSELERKFIAGEITAEDVRKRLTEMGLWARIEYTDGRPNEFIGEALPPSKKEQE